MSKIDIRPAQLADVAKIIEIACLTSPEYPAASVEEHVRKLNAVPRDVPFVRRVAECDDMVVGYVELLQRFWTNARGSFQGTIEVSPNHQDQGVGSQLHDHLMDIAYENEARRVYMEIREDHAGALHFAKARDWQPTGVVMRKSRLDVGDVVLDGYDGLKERLEREDIRVSTLAELGGDDEHVLRQIHHVEMAVAQDEPGSETFFMAFERWRDFISMQPGLSPEWTFVARCGSDVIGTANLERQGPNAAFHSGTGVLRPYRGRGVARLLKLHEIAWSQAHGIDYLYAGNDVNNPRMYDINVRLGYRQLPSEIEMVHMLEPVDA